MLRGLLIAILSLLLGGCWGSEQRFFGSGDWAKLDVDGEYRVETIDADETSDRAVITVQPDGIIEIAPADGQQSRETLRLGLVAIPRGSGLYFLAVDRGERGTGEGDFYVIAKIADHAVEFYFPDCEGTPPIEGLVRDEGLAMGTCEFLTRDALFEAALQAEHFLIEPHIVRVSPFTRFEKIDPEDDAYLVEE